MSSRWGDPGSTGYGEQPGRRREPGDGMLKAGAASAAWGAGLKVRAAQLPSAAPRGEALARATTRSARVASAEANRMRGPRGRRRQAFAAERLDRAVRDEAAARVESRTVGARQRALSRSGTKMIAAGAGLAALGGLRHELSDRYPRGLT